MNPKLQFFEVEPIVLRDNDFAVENASRGGSCAFSGSSNSGVYRFSDFASRL